VPPDELVALAAAVLRTTREPERVLEVGCGDGERTLFLAREFPRARIRGVDPAEEMVRAATARVGLDPEGRVAFKRGDGSGLPFPDEHFDIVVAAPGAETSRVLRQDGELVWLTRSPARDPFGLRARGARRRLRMHGFQEIQSGGADGYRYIVARRS
jgi:ubiquinone/menaquinone biosynthesis C-methylase UbiE